MANTATSVPVPPAYESPAIDEAEEEAAAAAEAANIGGPVADYAGPSRRAATEAERPLAEAGEGESEGQEQTEADLREAAAPPVSDEQRQIEEQANPVDRREQADAPTGSGVEDLVRPLRGLVVVTAGRAAPAGSKFRTVKRSPRRPADRPQ